ncbi:GNAT family N-acetyltransferase [Thalassotalea sediminis]|uniref:GNAT family N-acetyltransferase n=1 Tax=Thalassotalea sediminis TaxID=1759089 RepID=UPI0025723B26|nr:GNAT family N-acetyltransferase [Thalassotalea sediminis]
MAKHTNFLIVKDDLSDGQIVDILTEHLQDMYANSPAESVHALDVNALKSRDITFWALKDNGQTLGCVAIKKHNDAFAEIKSMRTIKVARNLGVATRLLAHVVEMATQGGFKELKLETGTTAFFKPARALYQRHGFNVCEPFGHYCADPHSTFMSLDLSP